MKAMIFAAGLGSRFKPWTDKHPKALALVNGKSLLQRNIEYLQQYGITEVIVNVHHFADELMDTIIRNKGWGSQITISNESGALLETGGGLKKAGWFFDDGPFVVINADILTSLNLARMISYHGAHAQLATLGITNRQTSRYFLFTEKNELCGWLNTTTGEEKGPIGVHPEKRSGLLKKAFSGIHIIDPRIFPLIRQENKFSIVDVYVELCATETIMGFDHSDTALIDVGSTEAVAKAEALFP